ncbi:hypothetical protein [Flavobacterium sp.]|uniref:hypothetical protein n=1 Tax=Flavobacterium sp. TaxID=239 RepID=UPI003C3954A5
MKNLIKFLGLITLVLIMFSCEEESNFKQSEIELVPVYTLINTGTDIVSKGGPVSINVYRKKPLLVEYSSSVNATSYAITNYVDTSSETNYEIRFSKVNNGVSVEYTISAVKGTGSGTLSVASAIPVVYPIKISEKEVYN